MTTTTTHTLSVAERFAAHDAQIMARAAGRHEFATRIGDAIARESYAHCYSTDVVEDAVAFVREVLA